MGDRGDAKAQTALLWSGGKDALLALLALEEAGHTARAHPKSTSSRVVRALVTTVAGPAEQVTMHGVGVPLIQAQARALRLPLVVMRQPAGAPNEEYERLLGEALAPLQAAGVSCVAAGDLFLEDVRAYREALLRRLGVAPLFPLWQQDPAALARRFIGGGYRAVVASADTQQLGAAFAGRPYNAAFLRDLPAGVDACGERGAFHTFVTGGPRFEEPVPVQVGAVSQSGRMAQAALRLEEEPRG